MNGTNCRPTTPTTTSSSAVWRCVLPRRAVIVGGREGKSLAAFLRFRTGYFAHNIPELVWESFTYVLVYNFGRGDGGLIPLPLSREGRMKKTQECPR